MSFRLLSMAWHQEPPILEHAVGFAHFAAQDLKYLAVHSSWGETRLHYVVQEQLTNLLMLC